MRYLIILTLLLSTACTTQPTVKRTIEYNNMAHFTKVNDYYKRLEKADKINKIYTQKDVELLKKVNSDINQLITYKREVQGDFWQLPQETLQLKTGDCEDFALLKMAILKENGFTENNLHLLQGITWNGENHIILQVSLNGENYFLDNKTDNIKSNSLAANNMLTMNRFNATLSIME